jgi:hypothetical protein
MKGQLGNIPNHLNKNEDLGYGRRDMQRKKIELKYLLKGIWLQVLIILILTLVIFFAAYYQPG